MRVLLSSVLVSAIFLCLSSPARADGLQDMISSFGSGDFASAISTGEAFLKEHPSNADARFYLAKSYISSKQLPLAEDQLRACMALCPAGSELQSNCINLLKEISQNSYAKQVSSGAGAGEPGIAGSATNGAAAQNYTYQSSGSKSSGSAKIQNYGQLNKNSLKSKALPAKTNLTPSKIDSSVPKKN